MRDNQTSASASRRGSGRRQSPSFGRDGAMPAAAAADVQGRVEFLRCLGTAPHYYSTTGRPDPAPRGYTRCWRIARAPGEGCERRPTSRARSVLARCSARVLGASADASEGGHTGGAGTGTPGLPKTL